MPETTTSSDRRLAATIGKNTIFGIVASATRVGTRLFTVPVVIYHLGLGGYGIWAIIMATAAYMQFGSAGIKSAFQKYVAEATGTGDFDTANKLLSTGSISMLLLSLAAVIPVAIFSERLAKVSGVPPEFVFSVAASITVLAAVYAISNFGAAFEAIVNGGHRIDITRKYSTVLSICEAIAIIAVLHFGYGLLAMTVVMGTSELIYIGGCFFASHRIVPQMHVRMAHFTKSTFSELIRFAGSYQLVNMLELLYGAILPIVFLKFFGADMAGVFAIASRVVQSSLIAQDALVLPILSGGTMVFVSGSAKRVGLFLAKAFKVTLASAVPPLAFVSAFGTIMVLAWTGQTGPSFRIAICLTALAGLLRAISLLQLVLYRASGRALLDNIRQVLRIVVILIVGFFGKRIGFNGVLTGMVGAELVGVVFMFFAMATTFHAFSGKILARDTLRIVAAAAVIIGGGALSAMIPLPWSAPVRLIATAKLLEIGLGSLLVAWPALILTKSVSNAEGRTLLDAMLPGRRSVLAMTAHKGAF